MSDLVERVALALLKAKYSGNPDVDISTYWPDDLASLLSGPPFDADGWRDMAGGAIEEVSTFLLDQFEKSPMSDSDDTEALRTVSDILSKAALK